MRFRFSASVILAASLCSAQQQPTDEDRDISWKKLVPNIVDDQKSIWSSPSKLSERRNLVPAVAFAVVGTALVVGADPHSPCYAIEASRRRDERSTAEASPGGFFILPSRTAFQGSKLSSTSIADTNR